MSYTEIYRFGKDGKSDTAPRDIQNAFRGAVAVWKILEEKYLPPYREGFTLSRVFSINDHAMEEIWHLYNREDVSTTDKIVLLSTLDYVLVRRDNIQRVIDAFEEFDKEHPDRTNLNDQASVLRHLLEDEDVSAVGWNQTSVNGDNWGNAGEIEVDEDGDEQSSPYNYNTGNKHWWLFDVIDAPKEASNEAEQ